jgi:MFS family permease
MADQAAALTEKPTRARYGVIAFAIAVAVITYIDRICISQARPFLIKDLGLTDKQFGWALTVFFWGYALFEIPGGWLGDRIGARKALTRVVVAWSIFTAATGWVTGLTSLLVVRFMFAAGEAGCFPNVARAFSGWLPSEGRARAQGIVWLAARWGGAITPPLVAALMHYISWRRTFELFALVGIVWSFFYYRWYRDSPEEHRGVNAAERALLTGRARGLAHGPTPWRLFLRSRTVWLLWAQYMAINFGWPFYITWLPKYLIEARHLEVQKSAWLSSIPLGFGGFGCIIAGMLAAPIARRTGNLAWTRKGFGMVACFGAAMGLLAFPFIENVHVAMFVMGLASFSNDLLLPSAWATCMDVGGRYAGTVSGSMNMMGNFMAGAATLSVPYILAQTNQNWVVIFYIAAGIYLLGCLSWAFIDPNERLDREVERPAVPVGETA